MVQHYNFQCSTFTAFQPQITMYRAPAITLLSVTLISTLLIIIIIIQQQLTVHNTGPVLCRNTDKKPYPVGHDFAAL